VTGHWELAGIVLERPFPTFPDGFPKEVIAEFERRIGRPTIGNYAASGTVIIDELGPEHMRTGHPIVYTSADSVFQIAAHEEIIAITELYRICEIAYELVGKGMNVGRIIARPFVGKPGAFQRTSNRHDYALTPTGPTLLDAMTAAGKTVHAIGKVKDLFAGRGVTTAVHTKSDEEGVDEIEKAIASAGPGLVFTNLVDFDTQYGHRNDPAGYAANLERFGCCRHCETTTCWSSPPITATIRRRPAPTTHASTCPCSSSDAAFVRVRASARAQASPISGRPSRRSSPSARWPTEPASFAIS
jgi:phosphopentomutase